LDAGKKLPGIVVQFNRIEQSHVFSPHDELGIGLLFFNKIGSDSPYRYAFIIA